MTSSLKQNKENAEHRKKKFDFYGNNWKCRFAEICIEKNNEHARII